MLPSVWPGVCRIWAVCDPAETVSPVREAAIDLYFSWRGHADPGGLHVQHFEQIVIVLVEQDGCAREGAELHGSAYVVDVGMGDDDLFDVEIVLADDSEQVFDVVAGIDDHGFAGGLVADDGAVALQRADGEDFVDHGSIVAVSRGLKPTSRCPLTRP